MKIETILLVENNKSTIELVNTTLTDKGYAVSIATTGIQAIEIAPKLQPSLILLDILMPGMDGYETCRLLKENDSTKNIPVIFLSALTKTFDKVKAFQAGGVDYLSKPIETDELLVRIHTHLTISSLQNELKNANEKLEEKVKHRTAELEETNVQLQSSISELFEKSEALQESEERYKLLVNNIMYSVIVTNFEGDLFFINQKAADALDIVVEEGTIIKTPGYWADNSKRKAFLDELKTIGFVHNFETQFIIKDNIVITVIISSTLIDYNGQKAILSIINDITKQKELEQKILTTTIETEEKERQRFAQELHDGIGPLLSATKMYLQWISKAEGKPNVPYLVEKTIGLVDEAHKTSREISHNLSPHILQDFGFVAALKNIAEQTSISKKLSICISENFEIYNNIFLQLGIHQQTVLYRVISECINNTVKHAHAKEITISVQKFNNLLEIIYCDNGIGFDVLETINSKSGLGLFNIKNRIEAIKGRIMLESKPGEGTTVKIQIEV